MPEAYCLVASAARAKLQTEIYNALDKHFGEENLSAATAKNSVL